MLVLLFLNILGFVTDIVSGVLLIEVQLLGLVHVQDSQLQFLVCLRQGIRALRGNISSENCLK